MGGVMMGGCCVEAPVSELGAEVQVFDKSLEERLACICYQESGDVGSQMPLQHEQQARSADLTGESMPHHVPYAFRAEKANCVADEPPPSVWPKAPSPPAVGEDSKRAPPASSASTSLALPSVSKAHGVAAKLASQNVAARGIKETPEAPRVLEAAWSRDTLGSGVSATTQPLYEAEHGDITSGRSTSSEPPTPQDEARRREQLQVVVKSFVMRALRGVMCHVLDAQTSSLRPAMYCVERSLQRLLVQVDNLIYWSVDLMEIAQVKVGIGHSRTGCIDPDILQASALPVLDSRARESLVLIEHRDAKRLLLLEQSARRAEDFRIAICILSMYGRDQRFADSMSRETTSSELRAENRPPIGSWILSGPVHQARLPFDPPTGELGSEPSLLPIRGGTSLGVEARALAQGEADEERASPNSLGEEPAAPPCSVSTGDAAVAMWPPMNGDVVDGSRKPIPIAELQDCAENKEAVLQLIV